MYPNLYYAFKDLFGVDWIGLNAVQSFGFFVAMAFLAASYLFAYELKRKEKLGLVKPSELIVVKGEKASLSEIVSSSLFGFFLGFKVVYIAFNFREFSSDPQKILISTEGYFLIGVILSGLFGYLKYREKEKQKLLQPINEKIQVHPYEHVGNMTMIAAATGFLGARIFHILENLDQFMDSPMAMIFSRSGFTMYGGLILASFSVVYYAYKKGIPSLPLIDACAPGLMLAYGIGRIGCHVSGDGDWGINNLTPKPSWLNFMPDWVWSYSYPHNVNEEGIFIPDCDGKFCTMLPHPVFPTPFYESVMCIVLFFLLWSLRKRINVPGMLFSIYIVLNGIERFFIEKIRVNNKFNVFGMSLTQAEIIAFSFIVIGVWGIYITRKMNSKSLSS